MASQDYMLVGIDSNDHIHPIDEVPEVIDADFSEAFTAPSPQHLQPSEHENHIQIEAERINTTNASAVEATATFSPQAFNDMFAFGGKEFFLNNSGTKRLVVGITSTGVPNIKINFKLRDLKNGWCIEFSKKSWNYIVRNESNLLDHIGNNYVMLDIFGNDEIFMNTNFFYNTCCIEFNDMHGSHVVLMPPTFERMMSLKDEIESICLGLKKKIADVAKRIKLFMDLTFFHLFKSNNIDCSHNFNWLMLFMQQNTNFMNLNTSVANTWQELGKWISSQETQTESNES